MENRVILREWFERVDSGRTGNITAAQLKDAFAVGNLRFSISVVQQMIRMHDFDRNGTMSFEEFVELNKFLLKVQKEFSTLERGRGFLVPDEVYEALVKIGFSLDSPAFYTVCESFDQTRSGKLRLDDFISLCIFVQSARNLFNSFDTSKQGRVTLDFNQFVYCSKLQKRPNRIVKFFLCQFFVIPQLSRMLGHSVVFCFNCMCSSWHNLLRNVILTQVQVTHVRQRTLI